MAKRNGRVTGTEPKSGSGSFVLVDLDVDERSEYLQWEQANTPDFSRFGAEILERGWKLSFSYSVYYGCYYGSATGKETGTQYDGYTLSVRHNDLDRLVGILSFLVNVLCPDNRVTLPGGASKFSW